MRHITTIAMIAASALALKVLAASTNIENPAWFAVYGAACFWAIDAAVDWLYSHDEE